MQEVHQDLSSKLSQLAAVSILGTMAATLSEAAQKSTEHDSYKNTTKMREIICNFAKEMKLDVKFSKPTGQR